MALIVLVHGAFNELWVRELYARWVPPRCATELCKRCDLGLQRYVRGSLAGLFVLATAPPKSR